jgi:putative DNA primase/helicase
MATSTTHYEKERFPMSGSKTVDTTAPNAADDVIRELAAFQETFDRSLTPAAAPSQKLARRQKSLLVPVSETTPMGLASAFLRDRYTDDAQRPLLARWAHEWYRMRDGYFRVVDDEAMRAEIWGFLDTVTVVIHDEDGVRHEPLVPRRAMVSEVEEALRADGRAPRVGWEPPSWLSGRTDMPPEDLLVCPNGLLHLPSRRFLPPDPDLFTPYGIQVPYLEDAPEPAAWLRFLHALWPDEPDCIEALQMMMGYFLTPDTSHHKLFLLVGSRRSGKGTIGRVIQAIMGARNVATPTLNSLEQPFGMQQLLGRSVAIVGDARLSGRADQAVIVERLLSISGEDSVSVDRKHLSALALRLRARVLLMSNVLPTLTDASGAFASRFQLLHFKESFFGREDRTLLARLLAELPGILKWSIEGWHALRARGQFLTPRTSEVLMSEFRELTSPISQFLAECCVVDGSLRIEISRLFEQWQSWCKKAGRDHPGSVQTFSRDLRSVHPNLTVTQPRLPDGSRPRFYQGLGLR